MTDNLTRAAALRAAFRREGCCSDEAAQACMRALALLEEARDILQQLIDTGQLEPGSPPEAAREDYLDSVIGMLTPASAEYPAPLRLVVDNTREVRK